MTSWFQHLLHTPVRDLAWYDMLAAFGIVCVVVAGALVLANGLSSLIWKVTHRNG